MNYVGDINEMVVFQLYFYRSCPAELCCSCEFDDYGGSQDICDINLARSLVFTRSEVSGIPEPWRSRRSAWAEFLVSWPVKQL